MHRLHIKNRGIPGDNTFGILERLDEVIDGHPAKVFIHIGINDIAKNFPFSVILHNYKRIVHCIKQGSPRTIIYFQALLPVNLSFNKLKAHYQHNRTAERKMPALTVAGFCRASCIYHLSKF